MVGSCYEKCIDKKFKDGDLNVGENSCVDRCTSKYWQTVGIVGRILEPDAVRRRCSRRMEKHTVRES